MAGGMGSGPCPRAPAPGAECPVARPRLRGARWRPVVQAVRSQGSASFHGGGNVRSGELSALPLSNQGHSLDPGP